MIRFRVPAVPVAQPRQRHRIMQSKDGRQFVSNYTPKDSPANQFKATVRLAARQVYDGPPLEGPISLKAVFVFPRPGRLMFKRREMVRCWKDAKPDADNLWKALTDSLSGLLFRDDGQIVKTTIAKMYAAGNEQPGVEVTVRRLAAIGAKGVGA